VAGFTETKHHFGKPTEVYACELVRREPGHVVLRYVADRSFVLAESSIPRGTVTLAHYWTHRGYVYWELSAADGAPVGRLWHLCRDVRLSDDRVEYQDLLLDVWAPAGGPARLLDEDQLAEAVARGDVPASAAARLRRAAERLLRAANGAVPS